MARSKKKNLQWLMDTLEGDAEIKRLASAARLTQICVLGPVADGQPVAIGTTLTIGYIAQVLESETQYQADKRANSSIYELCIRMSQILGATVAATPMSAAMENTSQFELISLTSGSLATSSANANET